MTDERIDPTDPASQADPDEKRVDDVEQDIEGAHEQIDEHEHADEPHFDDSGTRGTQYEDDAIAPP
jgi:hypothetical protein